MQSIHCGVSSCEHNCDGNACVLSSIQVGTDGSVPEYAAEQSHDTECASFSARG